MIITIPVSSEEEFLNVYALCASYALIDARNRVALNTQDASTFVSAMENDNDPVVRVRFCNVTQYTPSLTQTVPDGKEVVDFEVRIKDGETLLDNCYWYGRDCSTPGYLNVIAVDASKYDATKRQLTARAEEVRKGVIDLCEAELPSITDDKVIEATNAMLRVLRHPEGLDPVDYWALKGCDLRTLQVFCDTIMKRRSAKEHFAVWDAFHAMCYTPTSPWGIPWAHANHYMRPFHGSTRARGDGAFVVDVWKKRSRKEKK